MILPKDPYDSLAYTARHSGIWVPMPLRFARRCCCADDRTCSYVCSDDGPGRSGWSVDIGGIVENVPSNCTGTLCTTLNDTYILDEYIYWPPFPGYDCEWEYELDPTICSVDHLYLYAIYEFSVYYILVFFQWGATPMIQFRKSYGASKPACNTFSGESIPYDYEHASFLCDGASATCSITAL